MEETELTQMIESLRFQLIELSMEKDSFVDVNVIELSQQLDILLAQFQRRKNVGKLKNIHINCPRYSLRRQRVYGKDPELATKVL